MSRFNVMPRAYRRSLDAADRANVEHAVRESHHPAIVHGATAGGDTRKLRGIPAIGRNVRGAVPGTVPGEALLQTTRIWR